MRVGAIQASTRLDTNGLLFQSVQKTVKGLHEVANFGMFPNETASSSYAKVTVMVSLSVETQSLDSVVTGCSSGQGMMLAYNSLLGLRCGFIQTPQDAYLFGRINNSNVASLPLGLNFGWSGKLDLQYALDKLLEDEFGCGYPREDAERRRQDVDDLAELAAITKCSFNDILDQLDQSLLRKILCRESFYNHLMTNGKDQLLLEKLSAIKLTFQLSLMR